MKITRAKIYFPNGAVKYAVGTTYNKTKTCSKITVDYNVYPTIIIWYKDNQEKEEFFNLPFSVEYTTERWN